MSRIPIPTRDEAPVASLAILDEIDRKFGTIPNLFRLLAVSPHALKGYVQLNGSLANVFDLKVRERIAIAVAEVNGCDYCLSAHSYLGANLAGLSDADIALSRKGAAADPETAAIVRFAVLVAEERGRVTNDDLAAVRSAGLRDSEIIEIVALVAENVLTNFLNNVAQTDIDFPVVKVSRAA
jgi:uncharacterized peroxidase-related enzyme